MRSLLLVVVFGLIGASGFVLAQFRTQYKDDKISKWDIFYYLDC